MTKTQALTDAAGRAHAPAGSAARIVSLVPSITELLFDLGLGGSIVGRTAFCVHPQGRVRKVRSVGGTKQVNWEKLRPLNPTHVIVNIDETPRALADELAGEGYAVVVTHPVAVEDNLSLYRLLGGLFAAEDRAEALCRCFRAAYDEAVAVGRSLPGRRVLYVIWKDPWMTVSRETYISRMLELVAMHTTPSSADSRYPVFEMSDAVLSEVDLLLFGSEPFPFQPGHLDAFRAAHPAHRHKAALIDAEMVSWYGSRAIAGLEYLAAFARTAGARSQTRIT